MSLQPYLSVSQCQQLYGLERDIKHSGTLAHKFNQLLKAMVTPALVAEAQDHVAKRIHSLACPSMPNFSCLEWLGTQTLHAIGAVPRFSVLRWTLGEDSDLWFTIRTSPDLPSTRTRPCCVCGTPSRNYPLGPAKGALCNACCPTIDPWYLVFVTDAERAEFLTWSSMQVPAAPGSLDPIVQKVNETNYLLPEQYLSPCPLCNMGASTIDHWTHFCPVPHMVVNALIRPKQWLHIDWMSPSSHLKGITQAHLLFHTRRLVRERGALSPGHQTDPMCLSTACQYLARMVWESLPTSVSEKVWAPPGPSRSQCTFRDSLVQATIPAVHLESALLPSLASTSLPVRSKGKFLQCCRPMTLTCIIFCHLDALTHFPKLKSSSLTLSASAVPFILELWQLNPLNLSCFYHWPSLNMRLPCSSNLMVLLGSLPK